MNAIVTKEANALALDNGLKQYYRNGNLIGLNQDQKDAVLVELCKRYNLDLVLTPFVKIDFRGVEKFYLTASGTDQIAAQQNLTRKITEFKLNQELGLVECRATVTNADKSRSEDSISFYPITKFSQTRDAQGKLSVTSTMLQGEELANALMKAQTKAIRRATLSFVGMASGVADESEVSQPTPNTLLPVPAKKVEEPAPLPAPEVAPEPVAAPEPAPLPLCEAHEKEEKEAKKKRRSKAEIESAKEAVAAPAPIASPVPAYVPEPVLEAVLEPIFEKTNKAHQSLMIAFIKEKFGDNWPTSAYAQPIKENVEKAHGKLRINEFKQALEKLLNA